MKELVVISGKGGTGKTSLVATVYLPPAEAIPVQTVAVKLLNAGTTCSVVIKQPDVAGTTVLTLSAAGAAIFISDGIDWVQVNA